MINRLWYIQAWVHHPGHFCLKVSKSRKQNTKFSHTPKNQRKFVHFYALASKKWLKQKITWWFELVIRGYLTQYRAFFDSTTFEDRAKECSKFRWLRTWYFAFGIYWPLNRSARGDVPQTIYQYTIFFFQFKKINHANSILSDEKKRSIYDKHGSMGLYLAEQFGEDFVDTFMTMQSKWFQCCILSIFCLTGCCFCKSCAANFAYLLLWSLRPNKATGSSISYVITDILIIGKSKKVWWKIIDL